MAKINQRDAWLGRLREIRRAKNITQKQLGEVIGVNNSIISKYEKGLVVPPVDKLAKLAEYLQVSVDELLMDDKQEEKIAAQGDSRFDSDRSNDYCYKNTMRRTVSVDIEIALTDNDIFNWLVECQNPATLRYLGNAALKFAAYLENPDHDDFRSRA